MSETNAAHPHDGVYYGCFALPDGTTDAAGISAVRRASPGGLSRVDTFWSDAEVCRVIRFCYRAESLEAANAIFADIRAKTLAKLE